tara:strand:+ start:142 stop:2853 length:2712 start_codon:yes stop_codon:yes gene_type:complete
MPNNWSVEIKHYNITSTTETNITDNLISLPMATDTGTGEVNNARIILSAPKGKFITSAPLLNQYDRIRIKITDENNAVYNKVFDITKIIPSWTKAEGVRVTLMLLGIEHWLQKINHVKPFNYEGAFEVAKDVGDSYSVNKGTLQPTLTGHDDPTKNELPSSAFQKNNYDFGISEAPCMDRIDTVVDKLGGSVDVGGNLDFYESKFNSHATSYTTMEMEIFSSGSPTASSIPEISESTSVNVGESDGGIDAETGTIVNAWGAVDQGSLPINISQYNSKSRRLDFIPYWKNTESYKTNSVVKYGNAMYKALQNITGSASNTAPSSNIGTLYNVLTTSDYYGTLVYSPWTNGKNGSTQVGAEYWRDSGTNPLNAAAGTNSRAHGFVDGNVVVNDDISGEEFFRIPVDIILETTDPTPSHITSDTELRKYLYNNTTFYRGFRVLLKNSGNTASQQSWSSSGSSTADRNGKTFNQVVVQYTGSEWVVKYSPVANDTMVVAKNKGTIFLYSGLIWYEQPIATDMDCMHSYNSIDNETGIPITKFAVNNDSAVKAVYEYSTATALFLTGDHLKLGAWLNLSFPFPTAKINHTSEVGSLYGGAISGRNAVCEPATFDTQNMHLTHDGYRGFNHGDSSEDFGQISSLDFWLKIHYEGNKANVWLSSTEPNYKMRCILIDTSDNVVTQDFVLPFNNFWEQVKLPISGFTAYRGRKPKNSIRTMITPPKELRILNIFQFKNLKNIIIQTQDSYDEHGRYNWSVDNRFLNPIVVLNFIPSVAINRRISLSIDAINFTKPLLANTGAKTDRCLEGEFIERPEIMDYYQLKNDAAAELEKKKWRHVEYDITTTGDCAINFGDYFLYENTNIIPDEFETSGGSNKIKLVAKHIEYSITKPVDGKGGFLRRILGVRRFQ